MPISCVSILLTLGGKCLLNWVLVFLQKKQICRSFLGVFSVSLAVVDVAATLSVFNIYFHGSDFVTLFGYLMTQYDVCLLVQMVGQISRVLHWPVTVLAFVDRFCTVTRRLHTVTYWQKGVIYLFMTVFLWFLTALYIFLQYDFIPDVSKNDILRCVIVQSFQTLHITLLLLFVLACVVTFSLISSFLKKTIPGQSSNPSQRSFILQTLQRFLHVWIPFLVFLAFLLPVGLPSYLDLNVAWLCFVNSLLVAVILCAARPSSQLPQGLTAVPADIFCDWRY